MSNLNERFFKIKAHKQYLEKTAQESKLQVLLNEANLSKFSDALDFLYKFSEFTRNEVKTKLETLANLALSSVFTDKQMEFRVVPNRNKKGLFYELYITTDGKITPLED